MTSLLANTDLSPANPYYPAATGLPPVASSGINFKLKKEDRYYWETWGERNKLAIDEYNERIRTHGVWGAQYRTFARDLS